MFLGILHIDLEFSQFSEPAILLLYLSLLIFWRVLLELEI